MNHGLNLIEAARAAEYDKRPSASNRRTGPGSIRTRMGRLLVSLGERVGGRARPAMIRHDP